MAEITRKGIEKSLEKSAEMDKIIHKIILVGYMKMDMEQKRI